jgi:DNA-binding transcriptional MerR regulator
MAENFLIGQLAARTGRSVHTIRWYEAQGLIPGVARDGGRRRVYGELHISWLDLMDRLRRTGMSIAEMREYTALVKQGSGTSHPTAGAAVGAPRAGQGHDCRMAAGAPAAGQQDRLL